VAFSDKSHDLKASVMKFNGSSWEYVGEPGFSHSYVNEVAFAISPLGIPYIAFTDHGNEHKATVMKTSFEP
jgi:hypothetical protein